MQTRARVLSAAVVLTTSALTFTPVGAHAATTSLAKASCTKTSSGKTCIKAGQFCPTAKAGKKGIDAKNVVLVCKAGHWHKA